MYYFAGTLLRFCEIFDNHLYAKKVGLTLEADFYYMTLKVSRKWAKYFWNIVLNAYRQNVSKGIYLNFVCEYICHSK